MRPGRDDHNPWIQLASLSPGLACSRKEQPHSLISTIFSVPRPASPARKNKRTSPRLGGGQTGNSFWLFLSAREFLDLRCEQTGCFSRLSLSALKFIDLCFEQTGSFSWDFLSAQEFFSLALRADWMLLLGLLICSRILKSCSAGRLDAPLGTSWLLENSFTLPSEQTGCFSWLS